jgi:hypothetical protein
MTDQTGQEPLPIPAWAHAAGLLELGPAVRMDGPDAAMDRALISERIARYCWAYDERRLDHLAECFTEDAVWEGNVLGRIPIGPFVGREVIVRWLSEFWPHQHDQRRHMLLNTIVQEQTAETAATFSYLLLMASTGAVASIETIGFYRTAYRRKGGHWYIARLSAGFDKPFWPGELEKMSLTGRARHGVTEKI